MNKENSSYSVGTAQHAYYLIKEEKNGNSILTGDGGKDNNNQSRFTPSEIEVF
jgi:hypothetical protein